jgi:hypothetical protein
VRHVTSSCLYLIKGSYSLSADHPFHVSQLHIILDTTSALLEGFAAGLKDHEYDPMAHEYVMAFSLDLHKFNGCCSAIQQ